MLCDKNYKMESIRFKPRNSHTFHDENKMYIGEAYIKYDDHIDETCKTEHLRGRRDIYLNHDQAEGLIPKMPQDALRNANTMVFQLDRYVWSDPALESSQRALRHTKTVIAEIFDYVKCNWFKNFFPLEVELIETGSFFSNLRVGLPYEFDFMFDMSSLLPSFYIVEKNQDFAGRYFYSYSSNTSENIPNLQENIYYCIKTSPNAVFAKSTEVGTLFNVQEFCESLYSVFGEAALVLKEKWDIFDYSCAKVSPAFSFSMFYEKTGILVDLVPCFKFPIGMKEKLPAVNEQMNSFFIKLALDEAQNPKVNDVYDLLPLYLVCYDTEKPKSVYNEFTFRLSTSLFEKYFYTHLGHNVASALRVFRYLFQTFPSKLGETNGVWQKKEYFSSTAIKEKRKDEAKRDFFHILESRSGEVTKNEILGKNFSIHEKDPLLIFGCKTSVSSYFFTNLILKLLSTGELLSRWKQASPGEVFMMMANYKIQLVATIPSEMLFPSDSPAPFHHISVGSWFFADRSFACKTIALNEDEICGLESWLQGITWTFTTAGQNIGGNVLYSQFPLRCVIPRGICESCCRHEFFESSKHINWRGSNQCHIHKLVLFLLGMRGFPLPYDKMWPGSFKYAEKCGYGWT